MRGSVWLVLGMALSALALASPALPSTGLLIVTSDTTLTEDHFGNVVVAADNVTLDCGGYRVTGSGDAGITIDGRVGVTVKNCRVGGFSDGFAIINSSGNILIGNEATENGDAGFEIAHSDHNDISHNKASGNSFWGFRTSGNANRFDEDVALRDGVGFWVDQAADNSFSHDAANNNTYIGFGGFAAHNNTWTSDVANNNGQQGIALYENSSGNTVNRCVAQANVNSDAYDNNPPGANTWTRNTFGTTIPPGL